MRDCLPATPTQLKLDRKWIISADQREELFEKRNQITANRYNQHTKPLQVLPEGSNVRIQEANQGRCWTKYGTIIERSGRQYMIRVFGSGRVITRNRKVLKPMKVQPIE